MTKIYNTPLFVIFFIMVSAVQLKAQFFTIQAAGPVDVCYPNCVNLTVVSPQAGYQYNWFVGTSDCNGVTGSFPIAAGSSYCAMATGQFYCMGLPPAGPPELSNPIDVRVLPGTFGSIYMAAPTPSGPTACVASVGLCIPASFHQPFPGTNIKWYLNNAQIAGATSPSYTATASGYYKYTITTCAVALSDSTLVTIQPNTTITPGSPVNICSGASAVLSVPAGAGYTYQWKVGGSVINGATNSTYSASASGSYTVTVTSNGCSKTSTGVVVYVNPIPSAAITAGGPTTFCSGGQVTLSAPAVAGNSYQWKKSGNIINGAVSQTYIAKSTGNYKVMVTSSAGCSKTTVSPTVVTVNSLPSAVITPQGPTTFCAGGNVLLQGNTGTNLIYKWKKNGTYINGATNSAYTATIAGTYKVQVTNASGCSKLSAGTIVSVPCRQGGEAISNEFDVQVYPNPSTGDFYFEIPSSFSNTNLLRDEENTGSIVVSDVTGKVVFSESILKNGFILPGQNLQPGIYTAYIQIGESRIFKKIVKTK